MKNYDLKKLIQTTAALGSLIAMSGAAAQAGVFQLTSPAPGTTTSAYSTGTNDGTLSSPYSVADGTNTVTFKSTVEPTGAAAFETFNNQISPYTHTSFDFPLGTQLIDTFDPTDLTITGPLEIDFTNPVGSFGFYSQSSAQDSEQFTFSVYNSANTLLNTFTTPVTDNTTGNGVALFLGAQSTNTDISKVIVSSLSNASGYTGSSNDFYTGPLTVGAAVPEASTFVGFGLGIVFFGGLSWNTCKRESKLAKV